jgi:hypothetical protein
MASNHSSIYMRGLFDGLREGMSTDMTPRKFKLALDSQTTICKKIFEYVPIAEAQTANQIVTAMRYTSTRPDLKTATGCLNSLKDAGIVIESERGLFRQVIPREVSPVPTIKEAINTMALKREPQTNFSPILPAEYEKAVTANVKVTQPIDDKDDNTMPVCTPAKAREASPAEIFGSLANALRNQAKAMLSMADDLEAGALAFEQDLEDANKRLATFNQLKALLTA